MPGDGRLDGLQDLVDNTRVTVAVGAPLRARIGITIAMVILRPGRPRLVYAKQHLHESETPYFVEGRGFPTLAVGDATLAPAICYELSVPEHAATAAAAGADVYAASVAKTAVDARRAARALAETARRHAMATVMANGIGSCAGDTCAGGTAAWGRDGGLLAELDGATQGLLMLDAANGTAALIHAER